MVYSPYDVLAQKPGSLCQIILSAAIIQTNVTLPKKAGILESRFFFDPVSPYTPPSFLHISRITNLISV